ncbi:hypothetical protein ACWCXB_35830 [Streptomyces sp. NPDC001514]
MFPHVLRYQRGWKTLAATVACAATVSLLTGSIGPAAARTATPSTGTGTAPHAVTHTVTLITGDVVR